MGKRSASYSSGIFRRMIPSMFHRRLVLLGGGAAAAIVVLIVQMARLTIVEGAQWRQKAEAVLVRQRLIPTARGRILDRRMRVLAVDRPSYDVCVAYPVITGDWAYRRARRAAYRAHKDTWLQIHEEDRDLLIRQYQQPFDDQVQQMWQTLCGVGGIDRPELEERKATVIRRVKQIASVVWDRRLRRRLTREDEPVSLMDVSQPIGEQVAAHALLINVAPASLIRFRGLLAAAAQQRGNSVWRQVSIEASKHRAYPLEKMTVVVDRSTLPGPLRREVPVEVAVEGVGIHFIGALRKIWKEDSDRRPYRLTKGEIDLGGYLPGDKTGSWGIEKSQEDSLRGIRGHLVKRLDTQEQDRREPVAGGNVVLSVDIQLQARVQAIMDPAFGLMKVQPWHRTKPSEDPLEPQLGEALHGSAVVLDVAQSHVLAAVSLPGFSRRALREDPGSVWGDRVGQPFLNRAVARAYQPGSIVKPLVLMAAVSDRKLGDGQEIVCNGHLDPDFKDRYRCWIYKHYGSMHGPLAGREAIARSCNIFFYTLGRRLGAKRLVEWYDRFGLGGLTGCGLGEEVRGDLPNLDRVDHPYSSGFSAADAIFMAIGQGPVRWTPLQAAGSYAAMARGGYMISPSFIMVGQRPHPPGGEDLGIDPRGLDMAMGGLSDSVGRIYGTTHSLAMLDHEAIFNIPNVRLYGKSGTAQGVPQWVDTNRDGRYTKGVDRLVRRGDHAWVMCLVQRPGSPRPDYVVAVVVEYGGSGGMVAGPIVNQILHAMRAEGYL